MWAAVTALSADAHRGTSRNTEKASIVEVVRERRHPGFYPVLDSLPAGREPPVKPFKWWIRCELDKQFIMNTLGYNFNVELQKTSPEKTDDCQENPVTGRLVGRPKHWQ